MAQLGSLAELALDAIGKRVYELCSELIFPLVKLEKKKTNRKKFNVTLDIEKAKLICKSLHDMVTGVPISLANDLTNRLLDSVDNWDFEMGKCKRNSPEEIIYEEIVKSVIHPAVTRIESEGDLLDCADIFQESVFSSSLCADIIARNIYSVSKLKSLHILHSNLKCYFSDINLPEHLTEFSGRCSDTLLVKLVESCKLLKYLDVFGSRQITNTSVSVLLKLNNLEKLNISQTKITISGIKCLLNGIHEKNICLNYLAFSSKAFVNFKFFENFPNLKLSLQLYPRALSRGLGLSGLCTLKNVRALQIRTSLGNVNRILQEIGNQLVFLDMEIHSFGPNVHYEDNDENLNITEILQIGQYCISLKCLHISIDYYKFPRMRNYRRQLLPGFQTVHCLALEIENEGKFQASNFFIFLISQCVNAKKITFEFDRYAFNIGDFMSEAIQNGYMKNVELLCFQSFCDTCCVRGLEVGYFHQDKVSEILELLLAHCLNLKVIGLNPQLYINYKYNSQRLRFIPTWCRCK